MKTLKEQLNESLNEAQIGILIEPQGDKSYAFWGDNKIATEIYELANESEAYGRLTKFSGNKKSFEAAIKNTEDEVIMLKTLNDLPKL